MKRFLFTAQVKSASGYQTFFVDAETREEADALINGGGDIYAHEVDVTDLEKLEFERETTTDDFGDFPPDTATAAACKCSSIDYCDYCLKGMALDVDTKALDVARKVMSLMSERQIGGMAQLQAKIQCLIAKAITHEPAPDCQPVGELVAWSKPTEERKVDFRFLRFDLEAGTKLYAVPLAVTLPNPQDDKWRAWSGDHEFRSVAYFKAVKDTLSASGITVLIKAGD